MEKIANCSSCNSNFMITPQEELFYKETDLPIPSNCPKCRKSIRDIFTPQPFYTEVKCDWCGKDLIHSFVNDSGRKVICYECRKDGKWENSSLVYEPGHFLEQYRELINQSPIPGVPVYESDEISENSTRSRDISFSKNSVECFDLSKCFNSVNVQHAISTSDCVDMSFSHGCSYCLEALNSNDCNKCAYIYNCQHCIDCYFSDNCRKCSDCFGCSGLRNKKFYIFNQQYPESEYRKKVAEFLEMSESKLVSLVEEMLKDVPVPRIEEDGQCIDCYYGNNIERCNSCYYIMNIQYSNSSGYMWHGQTNDNSWDLSFTRKTNNSYMTTDGSYSESVLFCDHPYECSNCLYCHRCKSCTDCLGCTRLISSKFHILNTPYSEEEYRKLYDQIRDELNLHYS